MVEFLIDIKPNATKGIYIISQNIDDRVYVGRTNNFTNRAYRHKQSFFNGYCNSKIKSFIEENPDVSFKFSVALETDDIISKEEEYISKYNSVENGFNVVHNDEEAKGILKNIERIKSKIKKIKSKPKKVSEFIYLNLQKGYIRENGKIYYKPQKAKSILENCIVYKEEVIEKVKPKPKKIKKKIKTKVNKKIYDWASVGIEKLYF